MVKSKEELIELNKKRCREYHWNNREKLNKKRKEYYIENKEKIQENSKSKKYCDRCYEWITSGHFSRHCKTRKHKLSKKYCVRCRKWIKKKEYNKHLKNVCGGLVKENLKYCEVCCEFIRKNYFERHTQTEKHKKKEIEYNKLFLK